MDTVECGSGSTVCIFKDGNALRISPLTPAIEPIVARALQYTKRYYERVGGRSGKGKIITRQVLCYEKFSMGGQWHAVTNTGYLPRLKAVLREHGYVVVVHNVRPSAPKRKQRLEPNWANVKSFLGDKQLRPGQMKMLIAITKSDRGRVWWATGIGKSFMVPLICKLYPKANIVVTTRFQAPLEDLYKNLARHLPSVGIYSARKKHVGKRVMCISAGCLHHINQDDIDILIADEIHELATDKTFEQLAKFRHSRMYGLSANMDDRFDGADFELEGVFGPIIAKVTYEEGVKDGAIVPIRVQWRNVFMNKNPVEDVRQEVARLRNGLWRNSKRNGAIAADARHYADTGHQVLVTVKTFEHACFLKSLLPDFELVWSPVDREARIEQYIRWGILQSDEPQMTIERLEELKDKFESGELRKVIATTVWNRGVNFKQLSVLIRADGGSSAILDTQIPGRLSRTHSIDGVEKEYGILIDYLDQFDFRFNRNAKTRLKDYAAKGWENVLPSRVSDEKRTNSPKKGHSVHG